MRKGISPLLGALVLVAIVMAVTTLVAPMILDFVERETGDAADKSIEKTDCSRASITIRNITCTENSGVYELSLEVRNTGYQDLTDFRLQAREGDGYQDYSFPKGNETLRADSNMVFTNSSFDYSGERGRFISGTCPTTASRDIPPEDFPC